MSDRSQKVNCTLVPVQGFNLLIPNACIEEVLIRSDIKTNEGGSPGCIGWITWSNQSLPLISFENIDEKIGYTLGKKSIIVLLRHFSKDSNIIYFGILANQIPQVIQANTQTLDKQLTPNSTHSYALSYVSISGKPAIIPDIPRIADSIENQTRKSA